MEFMIKPHSSGAETGPFTAAQILDHVQSGSLPPSFLVQPRGRTDWTTISALFGLPATYTLSPPYKPAFQPPPSPPSIAPVIRDSLIVWALTAIGGFIAGLASGSDPDRLLLSLAISNLLFGTVGFTIAGYLAPADKWRHLRFVALGAWLTGLINVVFFGVSFTTWFFGAFFILLVMVTGGGLSCLLKNASAFQARRATLQDAPSPLPPSSVAAAPHSHQTNYAEHRLTDLKRLYEQGLITSDEYATKRQQILAGL